MLTVQDKAGFPQKSISVMIKFIKMFLLSGIISLSLVRFGILTEGSASYWHHSNSMLLFLFCVFVVNVRLLA